MRKKLFWCPYTIYCVMLLVLFGAMMSCTDTISTPKKTQVAQIDSLNTVAFSLVRKRQWNTAYQLAEKTDSLAKISNYKKGSARSLRIKAYYWNHENEVAKAFQALQSSENLEKQTKHYKGLLAVYNTQALFLKQNKLYDDALVNYKKGLKIQDTSITKKQRSRTHVNLANVYTKKGMYDSAVHHYQRALLLNNTSKNSRQEALTYLNLGNVYSLSSDYKLAEDYYKKALKVFEKQEDIFQVARLYNNLGALFFEKEEDVISLNYFKQSIALKEQLGDSSQLALSYLNIAELYVEKAPKVALDYLAKGEDLFTQQNDTVQNAKVHITRVSIYENNNELGNAKKELNKAILLSKGVKDIEMKRLLVRKQADVAELEGNYKKAYQYRKQYEILNDSIFNEEKLWEIAALQKSHQTAVKKVEIDDLEKDKALAEIETLRKKEENKKLYAYLLALGILILLTGIIAFYFYKLKRAASKIASQQQLLLKERIQNLVNGQEIQIINATLEARKKEKEAISKELHNNIGSLLTSVKFHFQAFDEEIIHADESTKKLYDKTATIITNITEEVRLLSHRFDEDPIPDFNLKEAIHTFSKQVENKKLKVTNTVHGLDNFQNSQTSIFIFRMLQELVNNVVKHAKATALSIEITKNNDTINMMVEDNGKGFNNGKAKVGIGLKNLKKQLQLVEGSYDIDSNEMRGTIVNIDIPIH